MPAKPASEPLPQFEMTFEPMTIEHLGFRLYSTLPPALAELVSNAYDAESQKVEIVVPTGSISAASEVIVRDYGHGLSIEEIQQEYLPIGRNRRGADDSAVMSKHNKVRVTGRKGLGKLSAFGVAEELEFHSVRDKRAVCIRLNYEDMKQWASSSDRRGTAYRPTVVAERCGRTTDPDGVEVRLRKLHRRNAINEDVIRRGLAQRLSVIGPGFEVFINGTPIRPGDRVQRSSCAHGYSWDVSLLPQKGKFGTYSVTGWIGFLPASSTTNRGVDIFANNKAAELGSFFNLSSTHAIYARAYLVGELHADFLDQREDLISTARNSVVWESRPGQALQDWGQEALRWVFEQWLEKRRKAKKDEVTKHAGFDRWLEGRQPSEQRVAQRMLNLLVDDERIDPESATPLLEIVKSGVETVAFRELVDAMEAGAVSPATLIRLFDEWRVIEAREHLKLADGRTSAIERLHTFIESGALEVKQLQPLLVENLWLLDPAWTEADIQATYTKLLRENCKEPKELDEENRRLDILGVKVSSEINVVELKRPEKTLSREDLEQIEAYVDFARSELVGSGPDAPRYAQGLLLVGKLSAKKSIADKMVRLAGDDIRVATYADLYERAKEHYSKVERELKKVAPEYARARRKVR